MENSPLILQLIAIMFLLLTNSFFVAAEFALVSVRRTRVEELIASGNSAARTVKRAIHDPDRFIAATQLGITIASLGLGWIAEPALAHLIEPAFGFLPANWVAASTHAVAASAVAFAFITFLHVVIGELAPKSVALAYPEKTALWIARPTVIFESLFRPAIWLLNGTGNAMLRFVGLRRPTGHQLVHSVEELKMLVTASADSGELTRHEKEMIHNVFEFGDLRVREVMTPRPEMITFEEQTTIGEFLQTYSENIHSRYPIYSGTIDNITGYVAIKDVLLEYASKGADASNETIHAAVRPAAFVPETNRVGRLYAEMQSQAIQVAIVIDEFGGTAGMVTQEHLTEQIVGRLRDELAQEMPRVETIDEKTVQVDAQLRVELANEELGLALPTSDDYETISGFILYSLRRIPKEGDSFKTGNVKITITRMDGPKIEKVLVTRL
jgi:CBS domain containing-hemolysin-like protein